MPPQSLDFPFTTSGANTKMKEDKKETNVLDMTPSSEEDKLPEDKENEAKELPYVVNSRDNLSLLKLIFNYTWEKIMILIYSTVNFIGFYGIFTALSWKQYGLVDLICSVTDSNRFFIILLVGKFVLNIITVYFLGSDKISSAVKLGKSFCIMVGGLSLCALLQALFPLMFRKHFNQDDGSIEISPTSLDKVILILAMILVDFINGTFWATLFRKRKDKKSLISHVSRAAKTEINNVLMMWFLYSFIMIVAITSLNPNISEDVRIFVFGIAFPFIKVIVVRIVDGFALSLAKGKKMTEGQTVAFSSQLAIIATMVCTLSQLFVINQSCYDISLFALQYCPHELIKKCSWFTDHPSFMKLQMRIVDLVKEASSRCFKSKDKVIPIHHEEIDYSVSGRRYSLIVDRQLEKTANSITGRQAGEDGCMLVALFSVLSLFHNNCLYSVSPLPSSIIQPTNQEVILCVLVITFTLESITTIWTFVMLARVGIHVSYKTLPLDPINLAVNYTGADVLCLMLSAAMA